MTSHFSASVIAGLPIDSGKRTQLKVLDSSSKWPLSETAVLFAWLNAANTRNLQHGKTGKPNSLNDREPFMPHSRPWR
jgi:hypothetical protein